MITKRLKVSVITGAILGVFCIIGAYFRFDPPKEASLLFSLWYNRLLMGLLIGLPWSKLNFPKVIIRGAFLGFVVSFAYYSTTGFDDPVSFIAGVVYGMIIEAVAFKFGNGELKRTK